MAQFRATIRGQRGEASRLGSKNTGISARVNAWDVGIAVNGRTDAEGKDVFSVWITAGSNGGERDHCLGTFTREDLDRLLRERA